MFEMVPPPPSPRYDGEGEKLLEIPRREHSGYNCNPDVKLIITRG